MQLKIGNKVIMNVSSDDVKCLDNDLLSAKDWLVMGLKGKINNCKKRMYREWIPKLRERNLDIPSADSALIALILSQPDYKDRRDREDAAPGQTAVNVCRDSGKKAKPTCPWTNTETIIFRDDDPNLPTDDCDIH